MKIRTALALLPFLLAGCQLNPATPPSLPTQDTPFHIQLKGDPPLQLLPQYQPVYHDNTFAFSSGVLTISLMDAQGENQQTLVNIPQELGVPVGAAWSPRHNKLALMLYTDYIVGDQTHQTSIAIVNCTQAGNELKVIYHAPSTYIRSGVKWSPDGKRLAFTTNNGGEEYLTLLTSNGQPQADGGPALVRLSNSHGLRVLSDSAAQAATNPESFSERSTYNRFFWMNDSQHLIYTNTESLKVYKISTDDQQEHIPTEICWQVALSPDGHKLAYFNPTWNGPLYIYNLDHGTTEARELDPELLADATAKTFPRWSPDSQHVAFFGHSPNPDGSNVQFKRVYTYDLGSRKTYKMLPSSMENIFHPSSFL